MEEMDINQWRIEQGIFVRKDWDGKEVAYRWCLGGCQQIFRTVMLKDGYCKDCALLREEPAAA